MMKEGKGERGWGNSAKEDTQIEKDQKDIQSNYRLKPKLSICS